MKIFFIVLQHEFKLLLRSRLQLTVVLIFLALSSYSIYYGCTEVRKQEVKIQVAADSIRRAQISYQQKLSADTTTRSGKYDYEKAAFPSIARFSYNFFAANPPSHLAALSLGQRDLYTYYYTLNAQNLYTQTLKGEIYNPFKLSAGNFDLAFVLIYLLPLLIIAFAFDALSGENDLGTLNLLRTTSLSLRKLVITKLLFRFFLTVLMVWLLCFVGFISSGALFISVEWIRLVCWMMSVTAYAFFWFSMLFFIISFRGATATNALSGIAAWVVLLLIIPAIINLVAEDSRSINSTRLASLMRSRNMAETDSAMHHALSKFYTYYPQYQPQDTSKTPFFYFQGYSAFLYTNQLETKPVVTNYYRSVDNHLKQIKQFNWISPAVTAQDLLNLLASTDPETEFRFKTELENFHQRLFWFSNGPLFNNRNLTANDYQRAPEFNFTPAPVSKRLMLKGIAQLLFTGMLLLFLASFKLAEKRLVH